MKEVSSENEAEVVFELCENIFKVKDFSMKKIYIDIYRNAIINDEDVLAVQSYEYNKILYIYMNQDIVLDAARRLRKADK